MAPSSASSSPPTIGSPDERLETSHRQPRAATRGVQALAHWFAFQLSGRLVGADRIETHDAASAGAQIAGAAAVAVIASLPLPLTPSADEVVVVELVLAAFLGLVGFLVARGAGASRLRSTVCAIVVLVAAVAVALAKNALAGH